MINVGRVDFAVYYFDDQTIFILHCLQVSTPPPGLDRMIPGQITERDEMRMVPGRMMEDDDDVEDDADNNLLGGSRNTSRSSSRDQGSEHASNLRRMIPGQTDSQVLPHKNHCYIVLTSNK